MPFDTLPDGWTVWSDESTRTVLAYRPDVFDGGAFPSPCLPTIYVSRGSPRRARDAPGSGERWDVTLFLEPDVEVASDRYDSRTAAVEATRDLAARFARGDVDYRACYQVPRNDYLDALDRITGREA